jgi:uncharacterized protein YgiM (DUF1202 family)
MKKLIILMALLSVLTAACGTPQPVATATATVSPPARPSETARLPSIPLQPTSTVTPILITGTLTIKVNIRSGPGTSFSSLGQLEAGEIVQIIARDSQGTWYLILYPAAAQGRGWVAAQYITVAATPTPAGPIGRVLQRLNVRSGPGTTFDSLGVIEAAGVVTLSGKNATASWYQIDYSAGPGGRGWVTSQYIQTDATADLPVLDDFGKVVTPGTPGVPSSQDDPATPTIGPAYPDGDSTSNPAIRVTFSGTGTHQFIYSSQVSAPQGDAEDWVEFTPYSASGIKASLETSLACTGNGTLVVELWQAGTRLSGWGALACGDVEKPIMLSAGQRVIHQP